MDENEEHQDSAPAPVPGQVIQPGQFQASPKFDAEIASEPPTPSPIQNPTPEPAQFQPLSQPQISPQPSPVSEQIQEPAPAPQPTEVPQQPQAEQEGVVSWEASEHINYSNGAGWTLAMVFGGLVLVGGMYFLVDLMSAIVVAILLGGLIFYGKLKPNNVRYSISDKGISIDERNYGYSDFRSFSLNINGDIASIFLVPMQRFMVPITMYVAPETQDAVANILAQHLPNKQRQPDFMDRLSSKLRL